MALKPILFFCGRKHLKMLIFKVSFVEEIPSPPAGHEGIANIKLGKYSTNSQQIIGKKYK